MKKDTVYIDIEDDITSIIDKITASSSRVIALVPPKRPEVLQSVVNLKLLVRAGQEAKKTVVLVTKQKSLISLAGGVGLHTAKDLHSKPSIPDAPDLKDDSAIDEIVETLSSSATIGELDDAHTEKSPSIKTDDKKTKEDATKPSKVSLKAKDSKDKKKRKSLKVPNFDKFRSKMLIGLGVIVLLGAGWWYAFILAPTATIAINAQTSRLETKQEITLDASLSESDIEKFEIAADAKELIETVTKKFPATGEKQVGKKASGIITIQNCDSSSAFKIASATGFSANDLTFISSADVSVPGGSFSGGGCDAPGVVDVTVVAQEAGDQYNLASGSAYSVADQGNLVSGIGGQMSGGTSETVKVISQEDIDKAIADITGPDESRVREDLAAKFDESNTVIKGSFTIENGKPSATPKVDTEVEEGVVTVKYTYTQLAINQDDIEAILEANQKDQFDDTQQSIYETGIDSVVLSVLSREGPGKIKVTVSTSAFIGPKINVEELARSVSGKRFSEVVEISKLVPGVTDVEVKFAPFWVFSAPKNAEKIDIQLNVSEHTLQ